MVLLDFSQLGELFGVLDGRGRPLDSAGMVRQATHSMVSSMK